ncbi:hypothetical protein BH10PLA2_BH10PLA2_20790 [soil metagenome]
MPIHDWTRADAGLFHSFHHRWISALSDALNNGVLPPEYFALSELAAGRPIPNVLTLHLKGGIDDFSSGSGQLAVAEAPPKARLIARTEAELYLDRVDRITVRHRLGEIVAVIEIVSPGNKHSKAALRAFVEKAADFLQSGVHLLVVDLFPPTSRDPQGIHKAIWDEFEDANCELPADKPLTLASYEAGPVKSAYVDFAAVGDELLDKPLFLRNDRYVLVPLEKTYQETWNVFPAAVKQSLVD